MSLHRIVTASIFALILGLAGCGGGDAGDNCANDDECGSGLICAEIAVCAPGATDCPGLCGQPCNTDDECPEGVRCGITIGGMEICQDSTTGL
ncbi:MAG: hypothetical protein DRJ42_09475 [Deltaproteobacteria bacterium]|nr:MAG: hypothetical protein DRJ42_09475 [Deltaproteobacteria bacterium]